MAEPTMLIPLPDDMARLIKLTQWQAAEIARQWEPDHSSGADRRGWVLAKDARDDAWRLLQEHAQRIGPNATLTG